MNNVDDFFLSSKAYKYFDKNILKDKVVRDALVSFEEILAIKKNIISMYNTDDPVKVKSLIGRKINNISVTQKDFEYVLLIFNVYNDLYNRCKKILEDNNL